MSASDSPKSLANRCIRTQTGPRFSHYEPEDRRFESCRVHQAFPMKPHPASFLTPLMDSSERRTRTIPDTQTPNVCIWISLISPIHNMSVSFTTFVLHYCSDQRRVEALPRSKGCTFSSGKGGHLLARFRERTSVLPMHGKESRTRDWPGKHNQKATWPEVTPERKHR